MNLARAIDNQRFKHIQIGVALMRDWDPIGLKDEPMAADEYDMYIGDIHRLLRNNASDQVILD